MFNKKQPQPHDDLHALPPCQCDACRVLRLRQTRGVDLDRYVIRHRAQLSPIEGTQMERKTVKVRRTYEIAIPNDIPVIEIFRQHLKGNGRAINKACRLFNERTVGHTSLEETSHIIRQIIQELS